jgi:1-acyl-sn-glycerol-3-phosphate acyltransferase
MQAFAEPAAGDDGPPRLPRVRGVLVSAFRRLMRLYFREVERVGAPPGPETRGRVIVSNHTNALIDPILVLTDAACEISPVAKSTLWSVPGLRWLLDRAGAVPIVRRKDTPDKDGTSNSAVFDKVAEHLARGGNILIFPEGTSHSEPRLAPFRTGAARMLAAAEARGGVPPTFQAAALEFDARTDFRSRTLVLWGPVRRFADVPGAGEERIRAATEQMAADLGELLVEGDSHEERLRVARVAELLANEEPDRTLERWNGIGRQVELASRTLHSTDPELLARVAARVDAYYAELERLGLTDEQVAPGGAGAAAPREAPPGEPMWLRAALAPLAASGFALYALPYFLPRWLARKQDADAVSTFKLGAALIVYPLWMGGLVAGSLVLLPPPLSLAAAAIAIASPFAALRWLDAWYQRGGRATGEELAQLARLRIAARTAIDEARSRLPS